MRTILAGLFSLALILPASARQHYHHHHYHHLTHKYGKYLAWRHFHRHAQPFARRQHRDVVHVGGLTKATLESGQTIVVAGSFVERFVGFFNDLFRREGRLPEIGCYAPNGHMRNSLHHWGGACDVGQQARNVAWRAMYHVTDLAQRWGLTDGATWRGNPDSGHVEVNRRVVAAMVPGLAALRRPRPQLIRWAWAAPL